MYSSFLAILSTRKKIHGLLLGNDYYQLLTYNFDRNLPSSFMKQYDQNFTKKEDLTSWICTMFRVSWSDIGARGHVLISILFLLCLMLTLVRFYLSTQKQSQLHKYFRCLKNKEILFWIASQSHNLACQPIFSPGKLPQKRPHYSHF